MLLIGDFTGRIGDPTGKDAARVPLTVEQVRQNAQTYRDQVAKILDFDSPTNPVELRYNGEWFDKMQASDMIRLAANFTVQQMIQRDGAIMITGKTGAATAPAPRCARRSRTCAGQVPDCRTKRPSVSGTEADLG